MNLAMNSVSTVCLALTLLTLISSASATQEDDKVTGSSAPEITAQDLFDEVLYELALNYGGPSKVRAQDLREKYWPRLQQLCAEQSVCESKQAYPLLDDMLADLGDHHTNFYTPQIWDEINLAAAGQTETLTFGAEVRLLAGKGLVVTEVLPDSPAAAAELKAGDLITELGHFPLRGRLGMSKFYAAERLGQPATLTLSRAGAEPEVATLTGAAVVAPAVSSEMLDERTVLIRLRHFDTAGVAQDLHNALRRAKQQGAERAVLDLRGNGGGWIDEAMLSMGAWKQPEPLRERARVKSDVMAYEAGRFVEDGEPLARVFKAQRFTGPLTVLVDEDSASAAEFMARDLLSRPQTTVLGRPTAGVANSVTRMLELADGSSLQVTIATLQSADGQTLPANVQPTVPLQRNDDLFARTGKDPELAAALGALDELER